MAPAQADQPSGTRIEGLDAWRVLLMLGGLLLHGSFWQPSQPLFTAIGMVSSTFRMGSFFAISGFVCGLSMRKLPHRQWLMRRFVQIGLPTLIGWGLLCPLIWLLAGLYPRAPVPLPFDWHHIWFLAALLAYAPAAMLFDQLDRRHAFIERFARSYCGRRSLVPMLLSVGTVSFILMAVTASLVNAFASEALMPMLYQARNISAYLPVYLLGLGLARSTPLTSAVQRSWRSALTIVAATALLYSLWLLVAPTLGPTTQEKGGDLVATMAASFCPPAAFALIFRTAIAVRQVSRLVRRLCEASLTIYLLHLPLLLALNAMLAPIRLHPYLQYIIVVTAAGGLAYAAHVWIVRPVPLLLLLVNGRSSRNEQRSPSGVTDEPRHDAPLIPQPRYGN